MNRQSLITILLTMLMSIDGTKAFAQDLEVANADGVTIYYNWINDNKELAVTYLGSSSYTRQERTLPSSSGQKG